MSVAPHSLPLPQAREPITVFCGCDERYAQHLAVMLLSAMRNTCRTLDIFVLYTGLSAASISRLQQLAWKHGSSITFIDIESERLSEFYTSRHISSASYLRLLASEALPTDVYRAIYLDCDVLVCDDLGELWDTDLQGRAMGAVQDIGRPVIDPQAHNIPKHTTISDFSHYGIMSDDPYLNAGVLVLDLDKWRRESLGTRCLEVAAHKSYESHDQDVLNIVLHRNWLALPPRWNVAYRVYRLRSFHRGPYTKRDFIACIVKPGIIHFTGSCKPWQRLCLHPMAQLYWEYLRHTPWHGADPEGISLRKSLGRIKWKMEMAVAGTLRGKPAYLDHLKQ